MSPLSGFDRLRSYVLLTTVGGRQIYSRQADDTYDYKESRLSFFQSISGRDSTSKEMEIDESVDFPAPRIVQDSCLVTQFDLDQDLDRDAVI